MQQKENTVAWPERKASLSNCLRKQQRKSNLYILWAGDQLTSLCPTESFHQEAKPDISFI